MFWSIFIQATVFIAAVVIVGGLVGWLGNPVDRG